jgi:DNA-binding NarL/FixJ family response regulator
MEQKAILIVDDSILIIERITELLKDLEAVESIRHAYNYQEALTAIEHKRPDLVVLDINLPGINGIELLRYIKQADPSITVIMFTNRGNQYYRDLCKRMGADFFVDKSSGFDQLPGIISSLP